MIKFDFHKTLNRLRSGFFRFPLVVISGLLVAFSISFAIEIGHGDEEKRALLVAFSAALGIPLFTLIQLLSERFKLKQLQKMIALAIGLIVIGLTYYSFPLDPGDNIVPFIRYAAVNIAIHLLIAIVPFQKQNDNNRIWFFNVQLLNRFTVSLLYTGVLYVGLLIAYFAVKSLFGFSIREQIFGHLFVWLVFGFNIGHFCAGVPKTIYEGGYQVARPLRILLQYILLPLMVLYLLILYAYASKILISGEWPKGLISYLVSGVALLGIFFHLIATPLSRTKTWAKVFSRWFYILLLPLTGLLFYAIGVRVAEYGVTVNRYLLLLSGSWIFGICLYFSLGFKRIIVIPASLAFILLLCFWGPWGAFSISGDSQMKRLIELMETHNMLEDGKLKYQEDDSYNVVSGENPPSLPDSVAREMDDIIDYIADFHNQTRITSLLPKPLNQPNKKHSGYYLSRIMGVYPGKSVVYDAEHVKYYYLKNYRYNGELRMVKGYDYFLNLHLYEYDSSVNYTTIDNDSLQVNLIGDQLKFVQNEKTAFVSLQSVINASKQWNTSLIMDTDSKLLIDNNDIKCKIELSNISIDTMRNEVRSMNAAVYYTLK